VNARQWFQFEVAPSVLAVPATLRLADFDGRWAAVVRCGPNATNGVGATAREALLAALSPLGPRTTTAIMAEPIMFAASADLLAAI
jgi:hypothetical protein